MHLSENFKKLSIENGEYSLRLSVQGIEGSKFVPNIRYPHTCVFAF